MSQMLKSSGAMGLATLFSRVLGLLRVMIYARFMGAGPVAGAFTLAFMIPNLFRRLLGEGALTAAFIPVFKDQEKNAGETEMWRSANAVIAALVMASAGVIVLVEIGLRGVLRWGHFEGGARLMLELLSIMFPYMLLVCLAAVFMAMLNARGHFFLPALGATVLNVVMIATVLWIAPRMGGDLETQIFALAGGVLVAGLLQAGFQLPVLWREGFRWRWVTPWKNPTVRVVVRRMIPGTIGVAAFQINMLGTQGVAFWYDPTIVAAFEYGVRLMEFPQGVFGVSLATFLLPTLAGLASDRRTDEYKATLDQGLDHLLYVNLAVTAITLALAEPIVRLLFERGQFTPEDTRAAAQALFWLVPGLVGFSTTGILARAFFALGDTRTPMKLSVVCLGVNLFLVLVLVIPWRQGGLGLANSLSSCLNAGLLLWALRLKLNGLGLRVVRRGVLPAMACAVGAGLVAWVVLDWWQARWAGPGILAKAGAVFVPMLVAGLFYGVTTWLLRVSTARQLARLAGRAAR